MHHSLSVSIVVYDTDVAILEKTFASLEAAQYFLLTKLDFAVQVYLVDNSPASRYSKLFSTKNLSIIDNPANGGHGYGNNLAINKIDSTYHLVLNPDAFLAEDALYNAIEYLQSHPEVGLLAPTITGIDGILHYNCKRNPSLFDHFLRQLAPQALQRRFAQRMRDFEYQDHDYNLPLLDVASISGCCMLFRTNILKKIMGFDSRYFLYFEDDDITRRIREHAKTAYLPTFKLIHIRARRTHNSLKHQWYFVSSLIKYCFKWRGREHV